MYIATTHFSEVNTTLDLLNMFACIWLLSQTEVNDNI